MGLRQKWYEARRQAEGLGALPDVPITYERFTPSYEQNHSTAGLGTTRFMKWRWSVVDSETGRIQGGGYGLTHKDCENRANILIMTLVKGKRPVR